MVRRGIYQLIITVFSRSALILSILIINPRYLILLVTQGDITQLRFVDSMIIVLLNRNEERGEELKVPYHARAISTRDGNMPCVTATCLIPDTGNSSFCSCHLHIYKQTGCDNTRQYIIIPNNMRQYAIMRQLAEFGG